MKYRFFDSASTTRCCEAAARLVQQFMVEEFGNPSSSHSLGQKSAKAIRDARGFFAQTFRVDPAQIIFTGGGTESDNLAIYGVALRALENHKGAIAPSGRPLRILASATEHPAVRRTVQSLAGLGFDTQLIPVDEHGQVKLAELDALLTPETLLVSIQQVNNITGAVHPIEELAERVKRKCPDALFHTDAVQAFGKVPHPTAPSKVDLLSLSAHKIKGPKGIGALVILNKAIVGAKLRPVIWGGEQEGGLRSGTQNAGLIAGLAAAAQEVLAKREATVAQMQKLQVRFKEQLTQRKLLGTLVWNSPEKAAPHIISLSAPGLPSGPLAKLLEERGFLISTGSACSSGKAEPDAVLCAMGLPALRTQSAIRLSFSEEVTPEDVDQLVAAFAESIALMGQLLGARPARNA